MSKVAGKRDPLLGRSPFTDGTTRDVYQGADGTQYVLDDWGVPVVGVWVLTAEAAVIAPARA